MGIMDKILAFVLSVVVVVKVVNGQDSFEVKTQQGRVRGFRSAISGEYNFLGVPYAKPPIDELRFKPPEDPDSYAVLDATMSKICPQSDPFQNMGLGFVGTESCLTLDIYTKNAPPTQTSGTGYPVLVYLPGGKFRYGGSSTFKPQNIYKEGKNVVIVVVNYRMGVLGFLSTEDEIVPGNMGLLDQSKALEWISKNIGNFGGDPQRVLLFGHDSGAVSVGLHLVSTKKSQGNFQRAAMLGGATENPWAFHHKQARRHAEVFASRLGCPTSNSIHMVDCLQKKDVREFIELQNKFTNITFLPVVDKNFTRNPFLDDKPMELIRRGQVMNVPVIFGMTANEGSIDFYDRLTVAQREKLPRSAMSVYLKEYLFPKTVFGDWLNAEEDRAMESIVKGVHYLYFRGLQSIDWALTKPNWTEMISDYYYRSGIVNMARLWAQKTHQKTYLYSLEYKSSMTYGRLLQNSGANDYGVAHMDDVFYYFNTTYFYDTTSENVANVIKRFLIHMISDLAEYGKITNLNTIQDPQNATVENNFYLRLSSDPNNINSASIFKWPLNHIDSRMDFWAYFIPDTLNNTDNYEHVPMVHAGYASATWGLVTMVVILAIVCIALVAVIVVARRNTKFMKVPTKTDNIEIKGKI